MVVRLSVLCTTFTPRKYTWHSFPLEAESTQGHSTARRIVSLKNSNDTIECARYCTKKNRTYYVCNKWTQRIQSCVKSLSTYLKNTWTPNCSTSDTYIQLRLLPQCLVRDRQKPHGAALHCDAINLHTHMNIQKVTSRFTVTSHIILTPVSYNQPIIPYCTTVDPINTQHAVGLNWVNGHAGVRGNEIADELTRDSSVQKFVGPEPSLGGL